MTRDEVKQILMRMEMSYPNFHVRDEDRTLMTNTWEEMLQEHTYESILSALKTFILTDTSGFAPSIGKLIENTRFVDNQIQMNETVAWGLVSKALRDSTYHAEEQFFKLPELIQHVVGSPTQLSNWGQTDVKSVETVIQSNFIKTYRAEVLRENQREKAPIVVRQQIKSMDTFKIQNTKSLELNEDNCNEIERSNPEKIDSFMKRYCEMMDGES